MTKRLEHEKLKGIEIPLSKKVLVIGSGLVAALTVQELAKMGHHVVLCSYGLRISETPHIPLDLESLVKDLENDTRVEIMMPAEILAFNGSPGQFRVKIEVDCDMVLVREVGAVILANGPFTRTNFEAWGVCESERVRSLSWLESTLSSSHNKTLPFQNYSQKFVLLCGITHHSNPYSQKRALEAALRLTSEGDNRVYLLLDHVKVASNGMERLARDAREAGVLFVTLTETRPEIKKEEETVTISYYDEDLGERVTVQPDLLVLEEEYIPSPEMAGLARILGIDLDPQGFFQGDNIYNRPLYTNRNGILVVGSAKGPLSPEEGIVEAKAAALEIRWFLGEGIQIVAERRLLFNEARCGRCLTCYRLCPHCAVSYTQGKPIFYDLACRACGICAAECPMDAIQIPYFSDNEIESQIVNMVPDRSIQNDGDRVRFVAFCCENSAYESARCAAMRGFVMPEGLKLVRVPCAGRVEYNHLLKALEFGADGVMVLGCHHESCKSVKGDILAKRRVEMIRGLLEEVGIEKERLFYGSLAPGMSTEFMRFLRRMEQIVRDLGVNPVK